MYHLSQSLWRTCVSTTFVFLRRMNLLLFFTKASLSLLPLKAIAAMKNVFLLITHKTLDLFPQSARLHERAALGIEPGTSRTRSENHATRPSSHLGLPETNEQLSVIKIQPNVQFTVKSCEFEVRPQSRATGACLRRGRWESSSW